MPFNLLAARIAQLHRHLPFLECRFVLEGLHTTGRRYG
jgi:hypothetical protein